MGRKKIEAPKKGILATLKSPVLWAAPVGGSLAILALSISLIILFALLTGEFSVQAVVNHGFKTWDQLLPYLGVFLLPTGLFSNLLVIFFRKEGVESWDWVASMSSAAVGACTAMAVSMAFWGESSAILWFAAFTLGGACHWIGNLFLMRKGLFHD